jgi:hypothetical protein
VRGERVKIRADDATFLTPVTLRNRLLLPVFSLLGPRAVEKTTAGLCRIGKRQFGDGLHEKNRSVDESGIIRDPACCRLCRCRHNRHTFAIEALLRWYRAGSDVNAKLPLLATFMGHVSIVSTEYYLQFVEPLATLASERFARHCAALVTASPARGGAR